MPLRPRILVAIADPLLRDTLADHLQGGPAMDALAVADAAQAVAQAAGHDLAMIDEALAHHDGDCLCRRLRAQSAALAVLLLAEGPAPACCAPDAVLAKPLRLGGVAARIIDVLARRPAGEGVRLGSWRLDVAGRRLVAADGNALRLTDKEAAILERLARAGGEVVARDVLLAEVWGYGQAIATHTLETHVYRLRRKLGADGPRLAAGRGGYRLDQGSKSTITGT